MPRVEIYARWDRGEEGVWESMIASIGVPAICLTYPALNEEVLDRINNAMVDAAKYEKGPLTDMAQKVADRSF